MGDFLSQEEIDALLDIAESGEDLETEDTKRINYIEYNFKRPNRVSSEHIRTISYIHEKMLRKLSTESSGLIRKMVDISVYSVDQMTYSEFTMSVPEITNFNTLSLLPLDGRMALECNPSVTNTIVSKFLGSAQNYSKASNTDGMTDIEISIFNHFLNLFIKHLRLAWEPVKKINFYIESQDASPKNTQIVSANEIIILVSLEITVDEESGFINLCYPKTYLEPILNDIDVKKILPIGTQKSRNEDIKTLIAGSKIKLDAILAETKLHIDELLELKCGNIILFDKKAEDKNVKIVINKKDKFLSTAGVSNRYKAVRITSHLAIEHKETIKRLIELTKYREATKQEALDGIDKEKSKQRLKQG